MSSQGSSLSKDAQGSQGSHGSGRASRQRRKRQREVAKQATKLLTRAVRGKAGVWKERSGSTGPGSQGLEGYGGEGFQSDVFLNAASLSQVGSERRASLDARVDVGHSLNLKAFPLPKNASDSDLLSFDPGKTVCLLWS